MGVGKSTLAEQLSQLLLCSHTDLDRYVELISGHSVEWLFSTYGEDHFRHLEEEALEKYINESRDNFQILSLGGGALISNKNRVIIKERTFCIYLRANTATLISRLSKSKKSRPLVKDLDNFAMCGKIENLMKVREAGYIQAASAIVDVDDKSIKQLLDEITSLF